MGGQKSWRWKNRKRSFVCMDRCIQCASYLLAFAATLSRQVLINRLRPGRNGRHFPDNIFKCIFLNENVWFSIKFSLKFVPNGPTNHIPALVQIMAWRRSGDKSLSEPMVISLLTNIFVIRPQWVNVESLQVALRSGTDNAILGYALSRFCISEISEISMKINH